MKSHLSRELTRKLIAVGLIIFVVGVLGGGSYYVGYANGVKNPEAFIVKGVANLGDDDVKADFGVFWEAWKKIKEEHIHGAEVSEKELVYGAIDGLVGALKDPNTIFLRADTGDAQKFEEDISGSFGGIGAEIGLKEKQLIVISPLKKSPAEKAGIKAGDKIIAIDAFSTVGIDVNAAVKKIRGLIGTKVILSILRDGWNSPKDFTIVRQEIVVPTVDWEVDKAGIAHVKLQSFNEKAVQAFYEASLDILVKDSKGMVLDLRNDPGGFLQVAIDIAGWFLDRGQVVTIEHFRPKPGLDRDIIFRANGNGAFKDFPMVILINEGSASASEILAGALRVDRGIKLVGEKSFGKGTVQELMPLRDNSKLKLTIATWLLPDQSAIEKNGLKPDYDVKLTKEDAKALRDPQLDKAKEILKQEIVNLATTH